MRTLPLLLALLACQAHPVAPPKPGKKVQPSVATQPTLVPPSSRPASDTNGELQTDNGEGENDVPIALPKLRSTRILLLPSKAITQSAMQHRHLASLMLRAYVSRCPQLELVDSSKARTLLENGDARSLLSVFKTPVTLSCTLLQSDVERTSVTLRPGVEVARTLMTVRLSLTLQDVVSESVLTSDVALATSANSIDDALRVALVGTSTPWLLDSVSRLAGRAVSDSGDTKFLVGSDPAGAMVLLNGTAVGTTPLSVTCPNASCITLRIARPGYESVTSFVLVEPGLSRSGFTVSLEPKNL